MKYLSSVLKYCNHITSCLFNSNTDFHSRVFHSRDFSVPMCVCVHSVHTYFLSYLFVNYLPEMYVKLFFQDARLSFNKVLKMSQEFVVKSKTIHFMSSRRPETKTKISRSHLCYLLTYLFVVLMRIQTVCELATTHAELCRIFSTC